MNKPQKGKKSQASKAGGTPTGVSPSAVINHSGFPDGDYSEESLEDLIYNRSDFSSESDLQKHVCANIESIIGYKPESIQEEIHFPPYVGRKRAKFRLDVLAVSKDRHTIIECKAPVSYSVVALVSGVTQLRLYGMVYESTYGIKPNLVLACTKINEFLTAYMKKFASDISLVVVGKTYTVGMYHA